MKKRILEVDFDSIEEIHKAINTLRSAAGTILAVEKGSNKDRQRMRFDACKTIIDTDISDLYKDLPLSTERKFYVYTHSEPNKTIAIGKDGITSFCASIGLKHIPFYIGKGTGNRAYILNRNETHRKIKQRLSTFNQDIVVQIIKEGLTECEALCLESKLIDMFGLLPNGGKLVNLDEGVKSKERHLRYANSLLELNLYYKNSLKV